MVTRAEEALRFDDIPATIPETDDWYAEQERYCPCGRPILPWEPQATTTDHLGREYAMHYECLEDRSGGASASPFSHVGL